MPRKPLDDGPERLAAYRAKRSAGVTPEPFGGAPATAGRPLIFVVQKHAARRLHYDFRLEWGGVLHSWAVPNGLSNDPADKRLAVCVEDHPIEYAEFEGVIPDGNYGAGPSLCWDRGTWLPKEEPDEGFESGKLTFELFGYKLRGLWHLFRTKGGSGQKDWLLTKKTDAYAGKTPFPETSVLSGRTLEELREGVARGEEIAAELARLGVPRNAVDPAKVGLMLAETSAAAFSDPLYFYELKYDGYRVLASRDGGAPHLRYRRGSEVTNVFPEISRVIRALPFEGLVLDGEIVVLDDRGVPSFNGLQRRGLLTRAHDVQRAAVESPATYFAFDLLGFGGFDLRSLPLEKRKALLKQIVPAVGPVRYVDHVEGEGVAFYREIERRRLEGMIAKKRDAPYRAGRSPHWLKVKTEETSDFVVVGFTRPKGLRSGVGALDLAVHEAGRLVYAGKVGSGFTADDLVHLASRLEPDVVEKPPCEGTPNEKGHLWVVPKLVVEVRFKEWNTSDHLRQPVFVRLRDDKPLAECVRETVRPEQEPQTLEPPPVEKKVALSNQKKVFWPEDGYTKGDMCEFYREVSPWLLPYLKERPLVLTRFPDGIHGKSFFQKDAPVFTPGWLRTERFWSEHAAREIDYFICDDVETLLYLANLGTIPLHVWASRIGTLAQPDWCILDLDPKGAPFTDVVAVALETRALCDALELPSYVKTTGSTGIHVLIPLGGAMSFDQSKTLAELLARVIVERLPEIATVIRAPIEARKGRIYVDFLQNGHGKLIASPLCVRPVIGAKVSTPLLWSEVTRALDPAAFNIKTVPARLERMKVDPMAEVLTVKPDLHRALARLAERMATLPS